jgi:hypothetical protein
MIKLNTQIRNKKKKDQTEINIIIIEKNHKVDLKDKIKDYKTLTKKPRKKKSKVEGPNQKILYIQIRIEGLY